MGSSPVRRGSTTGPEQERRAESKLLLRDSETMLAVSLFKAPIMTANNQAVFSKKHELDRINAERNDSPSLMNSHRSELLASSASWQ